ncbi:MAG: glycosyltransferase family 4 protein [bacterium]
MNTVCYIAFDQYPAPKGASTHIGAFMNALSRQYDVTLICLGATDQQILTDGVNIINMRLKSANYLDRACEFRACISDHLFTNNYDYIQFRTGWAGLPAASHRKSAKLIYEVNAVESIELKYHYPLLSESSETIVRLQNQEDEAMKTADIIVTPSSVTARYINLRCPEAKIAVIQNGVYIDIFTAGAMQHNSPPVFLYIGTFAPWQGVDLLLKAASIASHDAHFRLKLAGHQSRKWMPHLYKMVRKLQLDEIVNFLAPVEHDQVPALIQSADACLLPLVPDERNCVQGCSPLKALEYIACGKPVIAADLPVAREILSEDDTLFYTAGKYNRLAERITELCLNPMMRIKMGTNARQNALKYDWKFAGEKLLGVYSKL